MHCVLITIWYTEFLYLKFIIIIKQQRVAKSTITGKINARGGGKINIAEEKLWQEKLWQNQ